MHNCHFMRICLYFWYALYGTILYLKKLSVELAVTKSAVELHLTVDFLPN